jgi:hypothetical protein
MMESQGFYITLPSNASLDVYPNNTLTKYTVRLPRTLYLKEGYEVALAEIMYPRSWETMNKTEDYSIRVMDIDERNLTNVMLPAAQYNSVEELVRTINLSLARHFNSKKLPTGTVRFEYTPLTDKVTYKGKYGHGVELSEQLYAILGFDYQTPLIRGSVDGDNNRFWVVEAQYVSNLARGFHALYVYCNICKPQIVGDIYASLIRTVAVKGKRNEHVTISYNPPHYIPVGTREISEIEIDIRDDTGEKIPFNFGKVVCKLHFKQNEALHS